MRSSSDLSAMLYLAQILMNELYRNRTFADPRGDPLHRSVANIANSKNSWNIGLKQEGVSLQRPSLRTVSTPQKIGTRQNKPTLVALNYICQPIRARHCADKDDHGVSRYALYLVCI